MKFLPILAATAATAAAAFTDDDYKSGRVHEYSMSMKEQTWAKHRNAGEHDHRWNRKYKSWGKGNGRNAVKCKNGKAVVDGETFSCNNIDFYDFKSHGDLESWAGEGNDAWGWVAPDGREFVALGQADGTAFMEITKKGKLVYLGRLPQQSVTSIWRDMKTYKNYMLIGSEAVGAGVQVFDMTKLLDIDPASPKNFSTTEDLTGFYDGLPRGRSHNLVVHEDKDYAVAVGAQPRNDSCGAGLIFIDMKDPSNPTSPGCAAQDGYVHDAQCVTYHGPDSRFEGHDICYGFNEDTFTVYDVSDRNSGVNTSTVLSSTPYKGAAYTHQGWLLDESWQQFLFSNDELDEVDGVEPAADGKSVMYIWDISDLTAPKNTGYYKSETKSIDHNLYIHDGLAYHSNYGSGLRIRDVSGIAKDPSGGNIEEVAFFDVYPEDDESPEVEFVGTWSNYLFPSGYVFVSHIERGGFLLKVQSHVKARNGKGGNHGGWWGH
ncbi:hypothetical protein KC349_g7103 [Hortaea werneckii]|nr:hypothetical protein KC349_g7103 [Hortaea werneckii]